MNFAETDVRLRAVRVASRKLRASSASQRNSVLEAAARALSGREDEILRANAEDLAALDSSDPRVTAAFRDRLTLNRERLGQMAESLRQVAALTDPVGEVVERKTLENGLRVQRVRSPLGVIFMIFESRPNVAIEAFSLALKSGNVMVLRGGRESMRTTGILYSLLTDALAGAALPKDCLWGVTNPDRELSEYLLKQKQLIDVVVPRGGDGLIDYVTRTSQIPVIKNDRGLCHVYVHDDADLDMAARIVANAKCQRPGVCNSMETLLVHFAVAPALLPRLYDELAIEWYVDESAGKILKGRPRVHAATEASWDTEYLDLKMNCAVVGQFEEALIHIEKHGSRHSESIITKSSELARRFENEVDAAAVYWNASTRFTDGFALGLGGELGISTQKLHVRGPVGLRELTSVRWIIEGEGQVR